MNGQRLQNLVGPALVAFAILAFLAAGVMIFGPAPKSELDLSTKAITPFSAYAHEEDSLLVEDEPESKEPAELAEPVEIADLTEDQVDELLALEGWEVLEPVGEEESLNDSLASSEETPRTGQSRGGNATIVVITNFTRAEVFVNGDPYPAYSDDGQNHGMRVPAGQEHEIRVRFDENERLYRVNLRPGERRLLMVELTGFRPRGIATPVQAREREPARVAREEDEDVEDDDSQITVYSRPRGTIYVDNTNRGEDTPGSVSVEPGRREVQVRYEDGQMSETKVVRAREGSRIKLFFRQDN